MKHYDTRKSTSRSIQSSMFLGSLRSQMDKMASSCRKDELIKSAKDYMSDGCSRAEAEELLMIDGFDHDLVKSYMVHAAEEKEIVEDLGSVWGFDIEDAYGRITSSADLSLEIYASTQEEARNKIENFIVETGIDTGLERVVDIYKM